MRGKAFLGLVKEYVAMAVVGFAFVTGGVLMCGWVVFCSDLAEWENLSASHRSHTIREVARPLEDPAGRGIAGILRKVRRPFGVPDEGASLLWLVSLALRFSVPFAAVIPIVGLIAGSTSGKKRHPGKEAG
jgi:hypothetical protein